MLLCLEVIDVSVFSSLQFEILCICALVFFSFFFLSCILCLSWSCITAVVDITKRVAQGWYSTVDMVRDCVELWTRFGSESLGWGRAVDWRQSWAGSVAQSVYRSPTLFWLLLTGVRCKLGGLVGPPGASISGSRQFYHLYHISTRPPPPGCLNISSREGRMSGQAGQAGQAVQALSGSGGADLEQKWGQAQQHR